MSAAVSAWVRRHSGAVLVGAALGFGLGVGLLWIVTRRTNLDIDERFAQVVLAFLGLIAFLVLLVSRYRLSHRYRMRDMGRLMLIDSLLVVAGLELVADALDAYAYPGLWHPVAEAVAFACRGALVAGGIALVATIRWERER